jgi:hypothetical protein
MISLSNFIAISIIAAIVIAIARNTYYTVMDKQWFGNTGWNSTMNFSN